MDAVKENVRDVEDASTLESESVVDAETLSDPETELLNGLLGNDKIVELPEPETLPLPLPVTDAEIDPLSLCEALLPEVITDPEPL